MRTFTCKNCLKPWQTPDLGRFTLCPTCREAKDLEGRIKTCKYRHCGVTFTDTSSKNGMDYCCPEHGRREKMFRSGKATDESYFRANKVKVDPICQSCGERWKPEEGDKAVRCVPCREKARHKICQVCQAPFVDETLKNTRKFCDDCNPIICERPAQVSHRLGEHRRNSPGGRLDDLSTITPFTSTWWGRVGEILTLKLYPDAVDAITTYGNTSPFDATHPKLGRINTKTAHNRLSKHAKPSWPFQVAGGRKSSDTTVLIGFDRNPRSVKRAWVVPTSELPMQLKVMTPDSCEYDSVSYEVPAKDVNFLNQEFQALLSNSIPVEPKQRTDPEYERTLLGKIGEAIYAKLFPKAQHVSAKDPLAPYDFITEDGRTVNVRLRRREKSRNRWTFFRSNSPVDDYCFIGLTASGFEVEAIYHVPSEVVPEKGFSVALEGDSKWNSFLQPNWVKTPVGTIIDVPDLDATHITLTSLRKDMVANMSEEERETLLSKALVYHRALGFPYPTILSDKRLAAEVQSIREYRVQGKDLPVNNAGLGLCSYHMPHRFDVRHADADFSSLGAFHDDNRLKRALRVALLGEHPDLSRRSLRSSLTRINKTPTNFRATVTKALVECYCPEGGLVLDPCAGWGGRLMGTLVAGRRYLGIEPNHQTHNGLYQLGSRMCEHLNIPRDSYRIIESPIQVTPSGLVLADFALTSPPYWSKELYPDAPEGSVEGWVEDFLRPMFSKVKTLLKVGACFAVNVADVRSGRKEVPLEKLTLDIATQEGFTYEASWRMLKVGGGFEPILIFRSN